MAQKEFSGVAMQDLQGFFKEGEREKIYKACEVPRDELLIRLLWKSGRRIGELLQLRVQDIDFKKGMILWNISKKRTLKKAWKPMDTKTMQLLAWYVSYFQLEPDEYILHAYDRKRPITQQRCDQIVKRLCKKVGILKVGNTKPHCHHFRHSYAIDLINKSQKASGIRLVQQALEHSNLKMTEAYLQFSPEELRELVED